MHILYERETPITPAMVVARIPVVDYSPEVRSLGLHVSDINRKLAVAAGKLDDYDKVESPFEKLSETRFPLMWVIGLALEAYYASLFNPDSFIYHPGEWERDVIYGTPDGTLVVSAEDIGPGFTENVNAIWECKTTSKRRCSIRDLWLYLKQGLAYCAMSKYEHVLYDVTFLLGDYSRPYQPVRVCSLVKFDRNEIETWWKIILKTADDLQ